MSEPESGLLQRWSRRKLEAGETDTQELPVAAAAEAQTAAAVEEPSPEQDLGPIPDLDSLGEASDFSRFMQSDVAEALRRQALKKLFHLPEFNITDGLNDYDDDYTSFAPLGDVITHEMKRVLDRWNENDPEGEPADRQAVPGEEETTTEETAAEFDEGDSGLEEITDE